MYVSGSCTWWSEAQFGLTSCKTQLKKKKKQSEGDFSGLWRHPKRYRLWLWLAFSAGWWWRGAAVALSPAWGCGGRGSSPGVTWTRGLGDRVVFLFIGGIARIGHQTSSQFLCYGFWKRNIKGRREDTRESERERERNKHQNSSNQKMQVNESNKSNWGRKKKAQFISVEGGGRHWKAAIGWWGVTVRSDQSSGRTAARDESCPAPTQNPASPREKTHGREGEHREKEKNTKTGEDSC